MLKVINNQTGKEYSFEKGHFERKGDVIEIFEPSPTGKYSLDITKAVFNLKDFHVIIENKEVPAEPILTPKSRITKIEVGDTFRCIKDVKMEGGPVVYVKGRIYSSERDGCVTNKQNLKHHVWIDLGEEDIDIEKAIEEFNEHFVKI